MKIISWFQLKRLPTRYYTSHQYRDKQKTYLEHFEWNLLLNTVALDHVMIDKIKKYMFTDLICQILISSNL